MFRGHQDNSTADNDYNNGNFLALMNHSIKSGNTALAKHFHDSKEICHITILG